MEEADATKLVESTMHVFAHVHCFFRVNVLSCYDLFVLSVMALWQAVDGTQPAHCKTYAFNSMSVRHCCCVLILAFKFCLLTAIAVLEGVTPTKLVDSTTFIDVLMPRK